MSDSEKPILETLRERGIDAAGDAKVGRSFAAACEDELETWHHRDLSRLCRLEHTVALAACGILEALEALHAELEVITRPIQEADSDLIDAAVMTAKRGAVGEGGPR